MRVEIKMVMLQKIKGERRMDWRDLLDEKDRVQLGRFEKNREELAKNNRVFNETNHFVALLTTLWEIYKVEEMVSPFAFKRWAIAQRRTGC
jgi:hypothetical protein